MASITARMGQGAGRCLVHDFGVGSFHWRRGNPHRHETHGYLLSESFAGEQGCKPAALTPADESERTERAEDGRGLRHRDDFKHGPESNFRCARTEAIEVDA